jgi:hypothetical protein
MTIDIPSNHFPFQIDLTIDSKVPARIRILAVDPNKPATKYFDLHGTVDGTRKFELRFPVSPKRLKIIILNTANGDLPYGEDPTFSIKTIQVVKLKEYDVWWNQDTKNFYKFAVQFAQNAGVLSAGNRKPHIYRSNDGKFTIDYYNSIWDQKSQKFLTTPARIGHISGVIDVSKQSFLEYTVPMRLVILLHEFSHKYLNPNLGRKIEDETSADIQGLYIYLGKGWSSQEGMKAFLRVFGSAKNEANHKRYKIIKDFANRYDQGKIESVKN